MPSLGTINFHPSLLPAHRGGTPTRWVIFHGERATGVTAHLLTEEWDAGDILCAKELAVGTQEDWGSLEVRSIALAAGLMCKVAETLAAGQRFTPRPQDPDLATYERPFRQSDSVMDWEEPLELTLRRCRAAKPKWGGFFGLHGKLFCVWSVEPAEMSGVVAAPGTITQVSPGRWLEIACRNGALRITRLLSGQGRLVGIPHRAGNRTIRSGDRCELSTVVRRWLSPQGDPEPAAAVVAGHRATVAPAPR